MALTYVALESLTALCPIVQTSLGAVAVSLAASLDGALAVNAQFSANPPNLAAYIAELEALIAQIETAIAAGMPSVSFSVSDSASLVASLNVAFTDLITLEGLLGAAIGLYAFTYSGTASAMGAALTSELASSWPDGVPTSGSCNALILGAASSIAQTQLEAFLNGLKVGSGLVYTAKLAALSALSLVTQAATAEGNAAIQAQLDAALLVQAKAQANVSVAPPTLAEILPILQNFLKQLTALPNFAPVVSATANLSASLQADYQLMIDLGLTLSRADAQVFVYTYSGAANALGAAVTSALSSAWGDGTTPTSGACVAAILATTDAATWTTVSSFFGGA